MLLFTPNWFVAVRVIIIAVYRFTATEKIKTEKEKDHFYWLNATYLYVKVMQPLTNFLYFIFDRLHISLLLCILANRLMTNIGKLSLIWDMSYFTSINLDFSWLYRLIIYFYKTGNQTQIGKWLCLIDI